MCMFLQVGWSQRYVLVREYISRNMYTTYRNGNGKLY